MALTTTGYLDRKEIPLDALLKACRSRLFCKVAELPLMNDHGDVIDRYKGPMVFRELVDPLGKKAGFERILDEKVKLYANRTPGDKYLTSGSSTSGFTPIGFEPKDLREMEGPLVLCAGLADGYRLHEATGYPVACAVGENSLPKIAAALRTVIGAYGAKAKVIVTADNDPAGLRACIRSSHDWVVPSSDKDWSDVYQNHGGAALRTQFIEGLQAFTPMYEVDVKLEQMGLAGGGNSQATQNNRSVPKNRVMLKPDEEAFTGYQLGIRIKDAGGLDSLEQYTLLADKLGCYRCTPDGVSFVSSGAQGHGLLMSFLHDGLYDSLGKEDREQADIFSQRVLDAASKGMLEAIEPIDGSPVVAWLHKTDQQRLVLQVSSTYDQAVIQAMRKLSGTWDKSSKRWEVSVSNASDVIATVSALGRAAPGRLALASAKGAGFIACNQGREVEIEAAVQGDLSWLDNCEHASNMEAPPIGAAGALEGDQVTVSLEQHDNWDVLVVSLPFKQLALKEALKDMGASYHGKIWRLPISESAVNFVAECSPDWSGCSEKQVRDILAKKGFGIIGMVGDDRFMLKTPYSAELVSRLKSDLPKMARTFDADQGGWRIHVASGAIAAVMQEIAQDFDLRVLSPHGELLPKNEGMEYVSPRQGRPLAANNDPVISSPTPSFQGSPDSLSRAVNQSLAASRSVSPASG